VDRPQIELSEALVRIGRALASNDGKPTQRALSGVVWWQVAVVVIAGAGGFVAGAALAVLAG
jgi:hypothetical protein